MSSTKKMQIQVPSGSLFKTTAALSGLVSSHPVLPILNNFLFEIAADSVTITASDLYTTVITQLPSKSTGKGKIAVPASILIETLRNIPEQPLEIEIDTSQWSLLLITSNGRYRIACENPIDFPETPRAAEEKHLNVKTSVFKKALKQTIFAASKDDMHPNICGLHVAVNPDGMVFVATDGHRLARYRVNRPLDFLPESRTLASKSIQLLIQLLSDQSEALSFFIDKKHVHFWSGSVHIVCSVIDDAFPDYDSVIPIESPYQLTIPTSSLRSAIKIIDFYASKSTHEVCWSIEKGNITIEGEDLEFSNKGEIKLACAYEGEPMKIGINAKLFFDMIKNVKDEEVVLHFESPQKAVVLRPTKQNQGEDLLMLIMPISLRKPSEK
jgi:DNA polymerase-3 subunit beta